MRELPALTGLPDDAIYKEVVVIGNGPSGISVSHQLAGSWACVRAARAGPHPDPMLEARLGSVRPGCPLALQPLERLAEGLEGRSTNPVPLLIDSLLQPGADMGSDAPSMLEWKYYPERQIDHIVLGRGRPGGLWHSLDPGVVTLSPARWMALPEREALPGARPDERAPVRAVATYYERYVAHAGLQRFFRNHTMVTSVRPIKLVGKVDSGADLVNHPATAAWCVSGYDTSKKEAFHYVCSRVVLATGSSDRPNTLESVRPGGLLGAIRTPQHLRRALGALKGTKDKDRCGQESHRCHAVRVHENGRRPMGENPLPVLVIGSGLSAADAILRLKSSGLPVAHAYRGASTALKSLPPGLYPEYHQVHEMMRNGASGNNPQYTALPDHALLEIRQNGKIVVPGDDPEDILARRTVKLLNTKSNETIEIDVSLCVILIGSRPDLNFLPDSFEDNFITWNLDVENVTKTRESLPKSNGKKEQTFEMSLQDDGNGKPKPHPTEMCIKCSYKNQNRQKQQKPVEYGKSCFLKTQWYNLKYIVGQGLQKTWQDDRNSKKSDMEDVERTLGKENALEDVAEKQINGKHLLNGDINGAKMDDIKNNCVVNCGNVSEQDDPELSGSGLGLGVHPERPIDCRSNPISIDKLSHMVLNAPKGMYALGPLAGDNFVRFIPGGALAIVSHIWNEKKLEEAN